MPFVEGVDAEAVQRVEFYAQDIQILRDAGFEIECVSKLGDLRPADLFFVWRRTWGVAPIVYAKALRRPRSNIPTNGLFEVSRSAIGSGEPARRRVGHG